MIKRSHTVPQTRGDSPAFPFAVTPGMTKRELFAAFAIQGILADPTYQVGISIAEDAVMFADELIDALGVKDAAN